MCLHYFMVFVFCFYGVRFEEQIIKSDLISRSCLLYVSVADNTGATNLTFN